MLDLEPGKRVLLVAATAMEARGGLKRITGAERALDAAGVGSGTAGQMSGCWRAIEISTVLDMVVTGVGKASAAGGVARVLDPRRHGLVLSVGIAGLLPSVQARHARSELGTGGSVKIGSVVGADRCVFADEGVLTPDGFSDLGSIGFPPGVGPRWRGEEYLVDAGVIELIESISGGAGDQVAIGGIATVSTCSGTDALASEIARRTGAIGEGMEGAAAAVSADRLGVLAGEIRAISNATGDRERQGWNIPVAIESLSVVLGRLHERLMK